MRPAKLLPSVLLLALAATAGAGEGEVFYPEKAVISPFPREVKLGSVLTLKVQLKPTFHTPILAVTHPDGDTEYLKPARTPPGRKAEFDVEFTEGRGRYRVELVVDSQRGDTTAAQFSIYHGMEQPKELPASDKPLPESAYEPDSRTEDTVRLERELFRRMNGYRKGRRLPPLPWLEQAAILARQHWRDYLAIKPRPSRLTHRIPEAGFIADRFSKVYAWPETIRKFPIREPDIGPEAVCYASESLAAPRSLLWLFREVMLRESAFRAPVVSEYPTHAAVGMVRDYLKPVSTDSDETSGQIPRLFTAVVYVQVNSTRVQEELALEIESATSLEAKATEPEKKAEFLRRLGRLSSPESRNLFLRRLNHRKPEVRAAALDCFFLTDVDEAREWVDRRLPRLARAHDRNRYTLVIPLLRTFASVRYDEEVRTRGQRELAHLTRLSNLYLKSARMTLEGGEVRDAFDTLTLVAERFGGLPAAAEAEAELDRIRKDPAMREKLR